jgi:DHA2 family multidrug resistance protein
MPKGAPLRLQFDAFELDEEQARLTHRGRPIQLAPRAFAVLCALARQPGQLMVKSALLDAVWGHQHVTESVLSLSLGFGAFFGMNVLTPLWLQSFMGYTATWAGRTTAWTGVFAVVAAQMAGRLIAHVDPRRLIFFGLGWLALITAWRTFATTDMTYWQIARALILMGIGMPFFFVPIVSLALGCVEEREMASAAGLQNFLRTMSGAVATSVVTTAWENRTSVVHAQLVGDLDRGGQAAGALAASGMTPEAVRSALDNLLQGQSVMLATNQVMATVAAVCATAALLIWLAPKPARAVDMTQAGH